MKKLIVTDMDGTLTYDSEIKSKYSAQHNAIPAKNREAIEKLLAEDCLFAVATGRLNKDVQMNLGAELRNKSYILSQNGSFIFDEENQLVASTTYPVDLFSATVTKVIDNNLSFCFSNSTSHYYHSSLNEELMDQIFGPNTPKIAYDGKLDYSGIANICIVGSTEEETRAFYEKLTTLLDDQLVNFQITGPYTIDINPKAVSKGNGIKNLAAKLQIKDENIHVVGDSYNDASMFQAFANSYCMSHSKPDLQAQAKHTIDMFYEVLNFLDL